MISFRSMLSRRVVRILDTSRSLSTRAGRKAILATLIFGLASTTFAGLLGVGGRDRTVEVEETRDLGGVDETSDHPIEPEEASKAQAADVPITGRIVDLEGRPVDGVVVTVEHVNVPKGGDLKAWIEGVKQGEPSVADQAIDWYREAPEAKGRKATTDADGRFRIEGLGAERVVRLSLQGEAIACDAVQVVLRKTSPFPATPFPDPGYANHLDAGSRTIYGADFIYAALPGRAVEGVVRDANTDEPLAGAGVWSYRFAGSDFVGFHALKTTTDAQGRFRLNGYPRGKGNALHIVPNDDQPYFTRKFDLPDPAGTDPIRVDVPMHKGIWIEGAIIDRETGEPVPGALLHYMPFLSNTFAQATPEFGKGKGAEGGPQQDRYTSKSDGSFRLVGLPGRAIVGAAIYANMPLKQYMRGAGSESIEGLNASGRFETYSNPGAPGRLWPTVMKEIDPPADATNFRVDLRPTAGDSVRVRIAAPDGQPVNPVKTIGRISMGFHDPDDVEAAETVVQHLYPGEERTAAFLNADKHLGKVVRVKRGDDDAGPVSVALEPLAKLTGVVVDEDGATVAGARIRPDLLPSGDFSANLEETSTDSNGRFVVPDVPTGCDYALLAESLGPSKTRKYTFLEKVVVKPGETTDVGEIRFGSRGAQADQAAKPPGANAPITGRIVDLEGRPVAGVVVTMERLKKPRDGDLTAWLRGVEDRKPSSVVDRGTSFQDGTAETKTDAEGRFRINDVGQERVAILSLRGESIAYTTIQVATRKMEPVVAHGFLNPHGPGPETVYGAEFTYTAAPSRLIEGIVTESKSGRPIAGAEVRSLHFAGSGTNQGSYPSLKTQTDAQGRFQIAGMPKGKDNRLIVVPNDDQPYFLHEIAVSDPPGSSPVHVDAALHEGIWIEGKLTERSTGKPIPDARVHYFAFRSNPFAMAIPEFGSKSTPDGVSFQDRYTTKPDGSFRLVGLPGKGIVGAETFGGPKKYLAGAGAEGIAELAQGGPFVTYNNPVPPGRSWPTVMKAVDPPAEARSIRVDLEAVEGDSVRLRLVAGDGRALAGIQTTGLGNAGVGDRVTLDKDQCDASNLQPGEERKVLFRQDALKLGKVARVRKGDDADGPVVVTLEPLAVFTGRVVDPDGHPVSGVRIQTLLLPLPPSFASRLESAFSDSDGRFKVSNVPVGSDYSLMLASGQGLKPKGTAVVAKVVPKAGETTNVGEITLKESGGQTARASAPADVVVTGRIVDLEGRPVAGVVATVEEVDVPKGDDLTAWIEGVKKGEAPWIVAQVIDWDRKTPEAKGRKATTDADGRFRIEGLGAERVVRLSLRGETIAFDEIEVVLRTTTPFPARGFSNHQGAGSETIYGADFTYTAAPGRAVEGVVKDAKTGETLADVGVWSDRFAGSDYVGIHSLKTTTDAQGRFRLNGFPKGKGNALHVVPNDEQPYFMREFNLPDALGTDSVKVEVPVHKGIWIEGKITDRETGKPVPDARLHYMPFLTNTFARDTPEFGPDSNVDGTAHQDRYTSKADGSFRLVGLPGRAIVGALALRNKQVLLYMQGAGSESIAGLDENGYFKTYGNPIPPGRLSPTVMKEIDPPADATSFRVDLQPTEGDSVRVRIASPDGQPVKPVKTIGRTSKGSYDRDDVDVAEAEVQHLYPGEERTTAFRNKERGLGKVVRVKKGDDAAGPVPVALVPLAKLTGVVVDEDGVPVSGARIRTDLLPAGGFSAHLEETSTDANGRYVVPDVPTGCDYALAVETLGSMKTRKYTFLKKVVVKPGETTDVGEIRFGERGAQISMTPAVETPITGRIIDLEGRPIQGVEVKIRTIRSPGDEGLTAWLDAVAKGDSEERAWRRLQSARPGYEFIGEPIKTDADGRFHIKGLKSDRVVELMPEGASIAFQPIWVVTRAMEPITAKGFLNRYGSSLTVFHGADFTYTAMLGRTIEGIVKDARTGRPLAGVDIESERFAGAIHLAVRDLKSQSDAEGRFRIAGMPRAKGNMIRVVPRGDQPYFASVVEAPNPADLEPARIEFSLLDGIWVEGKLTDQASGKPIPRARLYYFPYLSNPSAVSIPGFARDFLNANDRPHTTGDDGSFRLLGLPGRGIVGALAPDDSPYRLGAGSETIAGMDTKGHFPTFYGSGQPGKYWPTVMKEIDAPADAGAFHVDLEATAGASVRLRVVGPDGKALTKVRSEGRTIRGGSDPGTLDTADAVVSKLGPEEERLIFFRQLDAKVGKAVRVRPGDDADGPVVVTLEPLATITGRIADADGAVVKGAMIQPSSLPASDFVPRLSGVISDADGRFVIPNVPTGCDYAIQFHHTQAPRTSRMGSVEKVSVKPGETADVGELRFGGK